MKPYMTALRTGLFCTIALVVFVLVVTNLPAAGITELQGITSKMGQEDIFWGDGRSTSTFSAPTYGGGTVTLTKVPALTAGTSSKVKGWWWVSDSSILANHSDDTTVGTAAWVMSATADTENTIVFPYKPTDYDFSTDVTFPATTSVVIDHGVVLACADTSVDIVFQGTLTSMEPNWQGSNCQFDITSGDTIYVSGVTEDIADHESRISTLEATVSASNSGLFYSSNHATTLTTASTYYVISSWDGIQAEQGYLTADTVGTITVDADGAGTYEIEVFASFAYTLSQTLYASVYHTRGTTVTDLGDYGCSSRRATGTENNIGPISFGCVYDLEPADALEMKAMGSTASESVTFYDLSFYARRE